MSWDPYLDLEHGVLRNRLGITDPDALADAESDLSSMRIAELAGSPLPGRYDLPYLQAIHWTIFSDVYPWAGQLRTIRLGKGGQPFCPPEEIAHRGGAIFDRLVAKDHLRGLARPDFVAGLTTLLADLNDLHPFREGNGRTNRTFCAQLARDGGYRIDWRRMDAARNVAASRAASEGDRKPLRDMLDDLVRFVAQN